MKPVIDDNGYKWRYSPARGKLIMDGDDTQPVSERGYYCDSEREALMILKQGLYISEARYRELLNELEGK